MNGVASEAEAEAEGIPAVQDLLAPNPWRGLGRIMYSRTSTSTLKGDSS